MCLGTITLSHLSLRFPAHEKSILIVLTLQDCCGDLGRKFVQIISTVFHMYPIMLRNSIKMKGQLFYITEHYTVTKESELLIHATV